MTDLSYYILATTLFTTWAAVYELSNQQQKQKQRIDFVGSGVAIYSACSEGGINSPGEGDAFYPGRRLR